MSQNPIAVNVSGSTDGIAFTVTVDGALYFADSGRPRSTQVFSCAGCEHKIEHLEGSPPRERTVSLPAAASAAHVHPSDTDVWWSTDNAKRWVDAVLGSKDRIAELTKHCFTSLRNLIGYQPPPYEAFCKSVEKVEKLEEREWRNKENVFSTVLRSRSWWSR